jgi:ATP-binding cassette subfamily F protein 3
MQRLSPEAPEQRLRTWLGGFDFRGEKIEEPISRFSGGEKARLALAMIIWRRPNILLLDEPTNHLDLEMRHALTLALQGYEGALVVVSHDRHLIQNTTDELMLVANGRVQPFEGDLHDYAQWLQQQNDLSEAPAAEAPRVDKRNERQRAAEIRNHLRPLKKQVEALEKNLSQLNAAHQVIEGALVDPDLYIASRKDELTRLLKEKGQLQGQIEQIESEWLDAQSELEHLEAQLHEC